MAHCFSRPGQALCIFLHFEFEKLSLITFNVLNMTDMYKNTSNCFSRIVENLVKMHELFLHVGHVGMQICTVLPG